jgi:phosphoribosylamine--glycine ligase
MKVLIVGGGGREHTLAWKIAQSPKVDKIFCVPGNAGIASFAECIPGDVADIEGLADLAESKQVDLTVVGPEVPLSLGIVDVFRARGISVFGPPKAAAILESSKAFMKDLLKKYEIPSAGFSIFDKADEAIEYARSLTMPIVVKADGLAAGKGVIICQDHAQAESAIRLIMEERVFQDAGNKVIVEEFLAGEEASFLAFTDGKTVVPMASSQDHKAIDDNDEGPNTGGMGAYSPAPVIDKEMEKRVMEEIMLPTVRAMEAEGRSYEGVLYAGLMIVDGNPYVLEFNCRFGDPETQALLPRLQSDLVLVMEAVIDKRLDRETLQWDPQAAVCIVASSGGYPGSYEKGKVISGLNEAGDMSQTMIFHAGTKKNDSDVLTAGGRVLGVTALGSSIQEAIDRAYKRIASINFEGMHYRKDIGRKALKYLS